MTDFDSLVDLGRAAQTREQQQATLAEQQAALAEQQAEAIQRRAALELRTFSAKTSLSRVYLWIYIGGYVGLFCLFLIMEVGTSALAVAVPALLSALAAWLWVHHLRRDLLRITAALPFEVVNLGLAVARGRSTPSCEFTIDFVGAAPDSRRIESAFAALQGERPRQRARIREQPSEQQVVIVVESSEGSKFDGHRRWLVRWWRDAARVVLPALHGAHPIQRLTFAE